MPIYGIQNRGLRFPTIGSIRKGIRMPVLDKETGKPRKNRAGEIMTYPKEVPYFVFHVDPTAQDTVDRIFSAYRTREISELRCFLAYPNASENFDYWLEAYTASQLVARSDEVNVLYLRDTETGEMLVRDGAVLAHSSNPNSVAGKLVQDIPIGGKLPYEKDMIVAVAKTSGDKITFKASGRLHVVIPEVQRPVTFTVITGAYWYDIPSIRSAVDLVDMVSQYSNPRRPANTIPVILRRVPVEVPYVGDDGQRHKKVQYPIQMEVAADVFGGLLEVYANTPLAFQLQAPTAPVNYPVLTSGKDEGFEDDDEFVEAIDDPDPFPMPDEEAPRNQPLPVNGSERPFPPEVLLVKYAQAVEAFERAGTKASDRDVQTVAAALSMIFGSNKDGKLLRHEFCQWLTGVASTKDMSDAQLLSLKRLMKLTDLGDKPCAESVTEFKDGHAAYILESVDL